MMTFLTVLLMSQLHAEVLPGEELYIQCASLQWHVDVLKTPGAKRDEWRMEVSRNSVRGWVLLENAEPSVTPLYQDRVPSPTVFTTEGFRLIVQLPMRPGNEPSTRQGQFFQNDSMEEPAQNLTCRLPWMDSSGEEKR